MADDRWPILAAWSGLAWPGQLHTGRAPTGAAARVQGRVEVMPDLLGDVPGLTVHVARSMLVTFR
ncbi:hypothetical protein ABT025_36915, partial [Streptomyces sp. NPDC002809]|uniref:hypothetical protein n=1 Tax=Streptomyces sp. NPDC002809 TaxID=3154433 RepID=UPI00331BB109